jgi:lysozyme family protein
MSNRGGVQADESQKDLEKAYKTQIDTIRSLIKLEEEQLKITQEKNKLEKESMESLVKGDVEEFFKKQSAVGATAAIASGDTRLQNLYGADALGTAFQDIQRQQEAGVQSL